MRKCSLLALSILVSGCAGIQTELSQASLILQPHIEAGGYKSQADITTYNQASINHLVLKLFTVDGGEQDLGVQKNILNAQLNAPVTFANLKNAKTYRVKSFAYASADESDLISTSDSNSYTDITLTTDDRPTIASIKVRLIDTPFNGVGTNSIAITGGSFVTANPEGMDRWLRISTVAGGGRYASYQEEVSALASLIFEPMGLCTDGSGNLYIADTGNGRIRKVTPDGNIHKFAGSGASLGDGGYATAAMIYHPRGLAAGPSGAIYLASGDHNRIRMIATNGIISTIAGDGGAGFSGDGGPAASAKVNDPNGIAVDSSEAVYIADTANNRIRKISGGTITTIAGNGTAGYTGDGSAATLAKINTPMGITVSSVGDVYFVDSGNHCVRKISGGTITTIAGNGSPGFSGDGGSAALAQLSNPRGIAVDSAGTLYVADYGNSRLRKIENGKISTIAGDGVSTHAGDGPMSYDAQLSTPFGVAVDSNAQIYVSENSASYIRKLY